MDVLSGLNAEINHLVDSLISHPMVGSDQWGFTQFMFWMCIALTTVLIVVFVAVKKQALVPKGRFLNGVEALVEFARNDIVEGNIAHNPHRHIPFLLTLFFVILFNNIYGLIPGAKPGTGTMGTTVALALISFVYFIYWGVKTHGAFGYLKSMAPSGLKFPVNIFIWILEVFSTALRLLTLSVRLFSNMFAGHVALGALAILTSLFLHPLIEQVSAGAALTSLASVGWMALLVMLYTVEILVAFIQAYVFTVLSAVYINLATSAH